MFFSTSLYVKFSFKVPTALNKEFTWQIAFPESHCWEARLAPNDDGSTQLRLLSNNKYDKPVWHETIDCETWYNIGVLVTATSSQFYRSTNDDDLEKVGEDTEAKCDVTKADFQEHHWGY
uniref:AlNc14C478G11879 protein n=1 Tax=Albugo laibachii Nc14 TaxID=890382 RepID=F0X0E0_9STRA|nr:AlNc14C478G11879 [Albugo laibachii Nc14]|eukprot:CCA27225.1 AlNc14C478G11879 [Albugo laibachii Nc14]